MKECIPDCERCHWDGSLGYCCSGSCIQNEGQDYGQCAKQNGNASDTETATGEIVSIIDCDPTCIANCNRCKSNSPTEFCCSGFCNHLIGNEFGFCQPKQEEAVCDEPSCVADCDPCNLTSGIFCCSGYCHILLGDEFGYCPPKNTSIICENRPQSTWGNNTGTMPMITYLAIGFSSAVILILGVVLLYWYFRKKSISFGKLKLSSSELLAFFKGSGGNGSQNDLDQLCDQQQIYEIIDRHPYDENFELVETSFTVDERDILGSGAFGVVLMGKLWNEDVAVKSLKPNADKMYLKALLTELKVLIFIGKHENVVGLLGAYTRKLKYGKVYLFLEFCSMGNLESYLKNGRVNGKFVDTSNVALNVQSGYALFEWNCNSSGNSTSGGSDSNLDNVGEKEKEETFTIRDMINWSVQIANALRFLSDKKVIHGDIASRNVLIRSKGHVKLTDFGLSRRLYEYSNWVYSKTSPDPLPWAFMSVEALKHLTFSTQSDIWNFGVFLWEIFSLGEVPFSGFTWSYEFIVKLEDGLRLPKPPHANQILYNLMQKCWELEPSGRPTFVELHRELMSME